MTQDQYKKFAERYDWMKQENPTRQDFFRKLFTANSIATLLDCACGTGRDLLMFRSMGLKVFGSDLSDSMLIQAKQNIGGSDIPLQKASYCNLSENYNKQFDAVVCLSNSINEPLEDAETLRALCSMKSALRPGGLLVFDQGQTDLTMQNPPSFAPILNNRDFTRFFTMEYSGDVQTVNIFDFIHTADTSDFQHFSIKIRIRLLDSWRRLLREAGFDDVDFFGDWDSTPYDKESSRRLITVARN